MTKYLLGALIILAFIAVPISNAQQYKFCSTPLKLDPVLEYKESIKKAQKSYDEICKALNDDNITYQKIYAALNEFHKILSKEAITAIPGIAKHLGIYSSPLIDIIDGNVYLLIPDSNRHGSSMHIDYIALYAQGELSRRDGVIPEDVANTCFSDPQCRNKFSNYMELLKDVYSPFSIGNVVNSAAILAAKDKEWTNYIDNARAQTFFDIGVTTFLYEWQYGKEPDVFSSPPKVQWFGLRPAVIIENVSDAIDGDQTKTGLALEVVGFNAWKDACFGLACGASALITHMDRNEIDKFGWGISFHVENDYSFGFTRHGDETGFFVTVDLLKLLVNKKSTFTQYKENFRSLSN